MKQEIERVLLEKLLHEKISARAFAQGYLSDLMPDVFTTLSDHGYFHDPIEKGDTTQLIVDFFIFTK